jgi:peptide/nickel transport system permease protein
MRAYIIRRLLSGVVILFILSLLVFVLLRVVGGDQAAVRCGFSCTPESIAAAREELGLNDPYPVQYVTWLKDLATGHLGIASLDQKPILETMRHKLPVTLELLIITVLLTVAVGVPFGIISALYRNSISDYSVRLLAVLGLAVPSFWVGTLVIFLPSEWWGYSPPFGVSISFFDDPAANLRQFVPPAAVLALASAAGIMRLTRSSLLEVMRTDYIRTARSKGLREQMVVGRHALKNSMIPVITVLGLQVSTLLGGSVIIEFIFALPGVGLMIYQALLGRDYQVVQSMTIYVGAAVVMMNLLVDISYAWLDPRIRYS